MRPGTREPVRRPRMRRIGALGAVIWALVLGGQTARAGEPPSGRWLDRAEYADRLRAMWLGEVIANWTGIPLEGQMQWPPFLTDAAWGGPSAVFVTNQDPWKADDDTDIEYVYLHALSNKAQTDPVELSGPEIRNAWIAHINRFIWVSNELARYRIGRGVTPPSTGLGSTNFFRLAIDAQLTTEFFGALAPGMPEQALSLANMPIQTTAHGHAANAAQVYALWYSLALQVPESMPTSQRGEWLVRTSRRFIPDTSKVADAMDFILADYLANPDKNDWESTRDKVYARFQYPRAPGYEYRGWTESSINFCSGVIALLYGEGDFKRTIQIGVLCGWDCDNAPATLGGLLGLTLGYDQLLAQFPGATFSDRFWIYRTRDALPDYLPADAQAEDTFTLMAQRMLPIIDRVVARAGGRVTTGASPGGGAGGMGAWLLPPVNAFNTDPIGKPNLSAVFNPIVVDSTRSNNLLRQTLPVPGSVSATSNTTNAAPQWGYPWFYGVGSSYAFGWICNGSEADASGREESEYKRTFYSSQNPSGGWPGATPQTFTVSYASPVSVRVVRLIEGDHWNASGSYTDANVPGGGGWFDTSPGAPPVTVELQIGGPSAPWTALPPGTVQSEVLSPDVPFQIVDWTLPSDVANVTGVRISGWPGGSAPAGPFVTIAEVDTLAPPAAPIAARGFDVSGGGGGGGGDATVDAEDLYLLCADGSLAIPAGIGDLTGDGAVDERDWGYLSRAVRWDER